jgi:hypothetical protein
VEDLPISLLISAISKSVSHRSAAHHPAQTNADVVMIEQASEDVGYRAPEQPEARGTNQQLLCIEPLEPEATVAELQTTDVVIEEQGSSAVDLTADFLVFHDDDNLIKLEARVKKLKDEGNSLCEFTMDEFPDVAFVEAESFKSTLQLHKISRSTRSSQSHLLNIDSSSYNIFAIRKGSPLLETFRESNLAGNERIVDPYSVFVAKKSFSRCFQDGPYLLRSFLYYLSRHYKCSNTFYTPGQESFGKYYSPLTCIHQSSGSGKSRLSSELSMFILPIILSGENKTGYPKQSFVLKSFAEFMCKQVSKPPLHASCIMTITHEFLRRVLYFSIEELVRDTAYSIDWSAGNLVGASHASPADRAILFGKTIELVDLINFNLRPEDIIAGFQDFIDKNVDNVVSGIVLSSPRDSEFEEIKMVTETGNWKIPSVDVLEKVLEKISEERINHLVERRSPDDDDKKNREEQQELGIKINTTNGELDKLKKSKETKPNQLKETKIQEEMSKLQEELKKIQPFDAKEDIPWLPHVLFVFDEGQDLLGFEKNPEDPMNPFGIHNKYFLFTEFDIETVGKEIKKIDVFRLIRRTMRYSGFCWKYCWATTISTNSSITNFTPRKTEDLSGRLLIDTMLIPPYIYHDAYDVLANDYKTIDGDRNNQKGRVYLEGWKRIRDILTCGRPLFYTFVESYVGEEKLESQALSKFDSWDRQVVLAFNNLHQIIQNKLNGGRFSILSKKKLDDVGLVYALLSSAVGLYGCPDNIDKEELVRRRMAWTLSVDMERNILKVDYPSEGTFNIMCGFILYEQFHTFAYTKPIDCLKFFATPGVHKSFATWKVIEILARMLFLYVHISTTPIYRSSDGDLNKMYRLYAPRMVKLFLKNLANQEIVDDFFDKLGHRFADCLTYFGYFQECLEVSDPIVACKAMLYRGSARYLPAGNRGADFMLPMVLKDGRYGLILVQVKGVVIDFIRQQYKAKMEMQNCTAYGVFKDRKGVPKDDAKRQRLDVKLDVEAERERDQYLLDFPTIRILINISSCGGDYHNGAIVVTDEVSPFLVIQTDGSDMEALRTKRLKEFFKNCVSLTGESFETKMPTYEAQYREPPIIFDHEKEPFNPVISEKGIDNDENFFRAPGSEKRHESFSGRPTYNLTKLFPAPPQ